ncbi:MAG: CarD family transcriptional regulator, partial [Clostridia bacterium]|nr:CarD family transcriptional regulator [Clostridia bacterium]
KKELTQNGKKLRFADEDILSQAEKSLYDEFAVVLDIKREDVLSFICGQIECREKDIAAVK